MIERLFPRVGNHHQCCSPMMRIWAKLYQSLIRKVVDDPLDVLSIAAHVACEPGDWLWLFRCADGA